jgi:type IV secretory pathway TraG/TraD family ATPase VirD4
MAPSGSWCRTCRSSKPSIRAGRASSLTPRSSILGIADYDTARYISNALGQFTISFETANRSRHTNQAFKPATSTDGSGEHRHGRSLLTPDEIMRLGSARPIVMIAGEPPFLLDRLDYRSDPACAGPPIPTR